ncbi:MAG: hypothetical protein BWY63_03004 [Chloroflexi bacterium ADurb.Bin360]|nr:MAG: hypothetical protein BWY63_03004 [Chloroflexi bacterium ADurb.Bin360]
MGETARRYFEAGGNVRTPDLQALYQRWRKLSPWNLLRRKSRTAQVAPETLFAQELEIPNQASQTEK